MSKVYLLGTMFDVGDLMLVTILDHCKVEGKRRQAPRYEVVGRLVDVGPDSITLRTWGHARHPLKMNANTESFILVRTAIVGALKLESKLPL